jgi:PAS domain S-box-containing protein
MLQHKAGASKAGFKVAGKKRRSPPVARAAGARRAAARRGQHNLRETLEQFRLAQETLGIATWTWDLKQDRVQWYGDIAQHLGLAPGSFSGRFQDYLRRLHPDDAARAKRTFVACLKGEIPEFHSEARVLWPDGSEHWLETFGRASYGPDGRAVRMTGVHKNITPRKRQEAARARAERLIDQVFEASPDYVMIARLDDARVMAANRGFERVTGYSAEQAVGRTIYEIGLWANSADREPFVAELKRSGTVHNWPMLIRAQSGKLVSAVISASLIEQDGEHHIVGIVRDTSEQRAVEHDRQVADARYRALFESAVDGMVIYRPDGVLLDANPAHCRMTGFARDELIGRHIAAFIDPAELATMPVRPDVTRRWARVERVLPRKDGGSVPVEIISGPMPDGNVLAILRDITRRRQAEKAIRLANERLESALADSHVSIWHADLRKDKVWLSDGWAQLVGGPSGETRTTVAELMALTHPEDRPTGLQLSAQVIKGERETYSYEHRVRTLAGEWRWIASRGRVVERDAGGHALRMSGTNIDITERKRAEEELRSSRRLLETVIDALPMSVFAKDLESNYVMVNKRMADFFGARKEQILRRHTSQLPTREATRRQSLEDDAWVYRNRQTLVHETTIQRPDGTPVPFHSSKIPLFGDDGALIGLLGINRDITEERRAQEALRESEQRFRAIFEGSRAGIATWALDGRFLTVNDAFCEFVGYAAGALLGGMSAGDLRREDEDEGLDLTGRMLRGAISHITRDRRYRRRDGSTVWGRTTVAAVKDKDGRPQYFVAVVIDITEAREAREQIERINAELDQRVQARTAELHSAVERLKEANRDLDSFNFSIAHDLRQPLNAIGGFADLLSGTLADPTPGDLQEFAREIETNAVRMEQMIEALLRFSNVGRGELRKTAVDMKCEVESALRNLARAAPLRAEVTVGELPAASGDDTLLRHVWSNLIGNALKYSGRSAAPKVEISGSRRNGALEYTVRDNGVGFDMRHADELFGVFQRLPGSAGFEGAGVGLAIVQRIVRRHGGQVSAEGAPGQGATFRFTLPA